MPPKLSISPKNSRLKTLITNLMSLKIDDNILDVNHSLSEGEQSCDPLELKYSDIPEHRSGILFDFKSYTLSPPFYDLRWKFYFLYKAIEKLNAKFSHEEFSMKFDDIEYLCNLIEQAKEVKVVFFATIFRCKKSISANNKSIEENAINRKIISKLKDPALDLDNFYKHDSECMLLYNQELNKQMGYFTVLLSKMAFIESYLYNLSKQVISHTDTSIRGEVRSPKTPLCGSNEMKSDNLSVSSNDIQPKKVLTSVQSGSSDEPDVESLGHSNPSCLELFFNCSSD